MKRMEQRVIEGTTARERTAPATAPGFRATLRNGRVVEVAEMSQEPGATSRRLGWVATAAERQQPGALGLAWFAPVPATAGHALAEVVLNPGSEGTGLALLLFDTVVLTAIAANIGSLSLFLPAHAEDFVPAVTALGGRILASGGAIMVVELPLGRAPRRYVGSGMHLAVPAAEGARQN